jgi:ferredoxin
MVAPAWILECLARGAAAVSMLACDRDDCRFGRRDVIEGRVDYAREVLRVVGGDPDAVRLLDLDGEGPADRLAALPPQNGAATVAMPATEGRADLGPLAVADALQRLAPRYGGATDGVLEHSHSPLGVVAFRSGCTACGTCASACPTGALATSREDDRVEVSFDARLCTGCQVCVPLCPERVVEAARRTDLRRLAEGRTVLHRDREARCEACGGPVAPGALLERLGVLLGNDPALGVVTRYCAGCRGTLA